MSKQENIESSSYIKPTKNFKFPKGLRPFLASIADAQERNAFRNMLVQATLHGNRLPEKKKKSKDGLVEIAV